MKKRLLRFIFPGFILAVLPVFTVGSDAPDRMVSSNLLVGLEKQLLKKDDILAGRFPLNTVEGKWTFAAQPNWFAGFTGGELEQKSGADLPGRTDASIREVLKRVATHQVRSLKDGDYTPVSSLQAARMTTCTAAVWFCLPAPKSSGRKPGNSQCGTEGDAPS